MFTRGSPLPRQPINLVGRALLSRLTEVVLADLREVSELHPRRASAHLREGLVQTSHSYMVSIVIPVHKLKSSRSLAMASTILRANWVRTSDIEWYGIIKRLDISRFGSAGWLMIRSRSRTGVLQLGRRSTWRRRVLWPGDALVLGVEDAVGLPVNLFKGVAAANINRVSHAWTSTPRSPESI
jgi:hypothetical protein